MRDFPGNYTDYREWRDSNPKAGATKRGTEPARPAAAKAPVEAPAPAPAAGSGKRKLSFKEQKEYETLEKDIEMLEARKVTVVGLLNGGGHHEELIAWSREIETIEQQIADKSDRWLELAEYV